MSVKNWAATAVAATLIGGLTPTIASAWTVTDGYTRCGTGEVVAIVADTDDWSNRRAYKTDGSVRLYDLGWQTAQTVTITSWRTLDKTTAYGSASASYIYNVCTTF